MWGHQSVDHGGTPGGADRHQIWPSWATPWSSTCGWRGTRRERGTVLQSEILVADPAHTPADVIITAAVIGGLILTRAGYLGADPVLALVVSATVVCIVVGIVRRSIPSLVDEAVVGRFVVQVETC